MRLYVGEDECSIGDKPVRKEARKRKHASRHAVNEADCPALLEEDSDEFKVRAFPAVEERARQVSNRPRRAAADADGRRRACRATSSTRWPVWWMRLRSATSTGARFRPLATS